MSKEKDYQALSLELDEVLAKLQQPNVHVDDAVKLYERGLILIGQLEKHLHLAENKIEQLNLSVPKPTEE